MNQGSLGKYFSTEKFIKIAVYIKGPINIKYFNHNETFKEFYIFVITDIYSRYTEISLMNNIRSDNIIKKLNEKWLNQYPRPEYILTDRGDNLWRQTSWNL